MLLTLLGRVDASEEQHSACFPASLLSAHLLSGENRFISLRTDGSAW